MAYGITIRVTAPVEMYDAVHREIQARAGTEVDGLHVHIARPTEDGFEVIEVWESRDRYEHYNRELVAPLMAEMAGGAAPPPGGGQQVEEFEVRGLVIPRGGVSL